MSSASPASPATSTRSTSTPPGRRTPPFGERIAHGLLVLSIAAGLVPFDPQRVIALRRVRDVVFKRPVRFGDTITRRGRSRSRCRARRRHRPRRRRADRQRRRRPDGGARDGRGAVGARRRTAAASRVTRRRRPDLRAAVMLDGKRILDHRRADRRLDRLPRRRARPAAGRGGRAHVVRPRQAADRARGARPAGAGRGARARRHRARALRGARRGPRRPLGRRRRRAARDRLRARRCARRQVPQRAGRERADRVPRVAPCRCATSRWRSSR